MYKHFILFTVVFFFSCSSSNDNMLFIEGGTFQMGDLWGDSTRKDDKPAHTVKVNDFYISKYEVTFEEFLKYLNEQDGISEEGKLNGYQIIILDSLFCPFPLQSPMKLEKNSYYFRGNKIANNINCPATSMTWIGAIKYCNWKSQQDDLIPCYTITTDTVICNWEKDGYRLPTEAEWEYTAGGGSSTKQKWAGTDTEDNVKDYMYFFANSGDSLLGVDFWKKYSGVERYNAMQKNKWRTHPVGTKKPNSLGIYNMSGNVMEYCWDIYDQKYYSIKDSINPKGPKTGQPFRVIRGGNYRYDALFCMTTYRSCGFQFYCGFEQGFRICRSAN